MEYPGLYSWWADQTALDLLSSALEEQLPELIYAGQAGATKQPSGTVGTATLKSRIGGNHIGGNVSSSTFRLTLASILWKPMALDRPAPKRLTSEGNAQLSAWIKAHLSVAVIPHPDRDSLSELERHVLGKLNPSLNLNGMPPSPARDRVTALRKGFGGPL